MHCLAALRRSAGIRAISPRSPMTVRRRAPFAQYCTFVSVAEQPLNALQQVLERHQLPIDAVAATADPARVERHLLFLELLGVPRGEGLALALQRHPAIFDIDLVSVAAPRVEYLLALGVHKIGSMVRVVPQYLDGDMNQLHSKLTLLHTLGLKETARWLTRNPAILTLDIETQLKPALQQLRSIEKLNLGKLLSAVPLSYVCAPPEKTAARLAWLKDELGVEEVGSFLSREPRLLTYSIENNMKPKLHFLESNGFSDPAAVARKYPQYFSLSLENAIAPRLEYVLKAMGRSVDDIAKFPQIFGYDLALLRARHLYLKDKFDKYSLGRIYRAADYDFAHTLADGDMLEYQAAYAEEDADATPGMTSTDKFFRRRNAMVEADLSRAERCEELRLKVRSFLDYFVQEPQNQGPAAVEAEVSSESEHASGGTREEKTTPVS